MGYLTQVDVALDGGKAYPALVDLNRRWNGYFSPYFTLPVALQVIMDVAAANDEAGFSPRWTFNSEEETITYTDESGAYGAPGADPDQWLECTAELLEFGGLRQSYWQVGGECWCWELAEEIEPFYAFTNQGRFVYLGHFPISEGTTGFDEADAVVAATGLTAYYIGAGDWLARLAADIHEAKAAPVILRRIQEGA